MSSIKFVLASQARYINRYKNIKRELLRCCANLYFNKQCLKCDLIPKYTKIHIPHTSPAATFTQRKIYKIRIKDENKKRVVSDGKHYIQHQSTVSSNIALHMFIWTQHYAVQ